MGCKHLVKVLGNGDAEKGEKGSDLAQVRP